MNVDILEKGQKQKMAVNHTTPEVHEAIGPVTGALGRAGLLVSEEGNKKCDSGRVECYYHQKIEPAEKVFYPHVSLVLVVLAHFER